MVKMSFLLHKSHFSKKSFLVLVLVLAFVEKMFQTLEIVTFLEISNLPLFGCARELNLPFKSMIKVGSPKQFFRKVGFMK